MLSYDVSVNHENVLALYYRFLRKFHFVIEYYTEIYAEQFTLFQVETF